MIVGFLLPSRYNPASGIWRKVELQASKLREHGARVIIFSFNGQSAASSCDHVHMPLQEGASKEKQLRTLIEQIYKANVDIVYLRRELWHPAYRKLMRNLPVVAEINTLERVEFKQTMSPLRRLYAEITSVFWRRYPSGFVSVTEELAASVPKSKRRAVISNGIPAPASASGSTSVKPHLFFSGTGSYSWHGIDKFIQMARTFPDWDFSFAGEFPQEKQHDLPGNFKSFGALPAAEADQLLTTANIGVGTLALHRKEMVEACPLKLRSYLSYGLPSIIGYKDTDFSRGYSFICQLENTENNIARGKEKIAQFVNENYRRRIPWAEVSFASESEKARLRYEFFESVSTDWKRGKR